MTTQELLAYLRQQGIELRREGGQLRYRGRKKTIPPGLVTILRQHKTALLKLLEESAKDEELLALSYMQKAFWFLYQLNPASSAYNGSLAVTLHGPTSPAALRKAFEQLCLRHPSLRTRFVVRDEAPWQQIEASPTCALSVVNAAAWSTETLRAQIEAEAHRPFDLMRETPTRLFLYQRSAQESVLLLCMHHIHMDGWSLAVLIRDFGLLYRSVVSGRPVQLPALPVAYSDFVAWQQHLLLSAEGESQLTYWLDELVGMTSELDLPTDWPRPKIRSERGARLKWSVSASLSQRLKSLAAQEGTTLNVLLLSVFATLLHRYSGQEEFLIGSPYHGRSERRWEHVLGCFINSMALRVRFPKGLTFRALLQEVRQKSHDAMTHADYPFPLLVERLRPQRDPSRTPLFQVMFSYENFQGADLLLSTLSGVAQSSELESIFGLPLTPWELSQQEGQFDLAMAAAETNGVVCYSFSYITDLFEQRTIERLASQFEQLLCAVTADPNQTIAALPLLSPAERQQILALSSDTVSDFPRDQCVHQLIEAQVARTPDACAVVYAGRQLSYRQLNCRANQLAHHLRSLGVGPEVLVGLWVERSPEMVIGLLAILKAGGAYVPLDPTYPPERLAFMLQDARPSAVVVQRALRSRLPEVTAPWVFIEDFSVETDAPDPTPLSTPAHLAYVIYTSGSTGRPKGAMIEHRGLTNYLHWAAGAYPVAAGQGVPVQSSVAFDMTVLSLFMPLLRGGFVELLPEEDAVLALGTLLRNQRGLALINITPAHLDILAQLLADEDLRGCADAFVIGGEALLWESVAPWKKLAPGARLINEYGPTETVVGCCMYEVGELGTSATVPIGKPIANTELYILDPQLQLLPLGAVGELHIGGAGVARGYLNRPELTAEKFIANPFSSDPTARLYKSGDLARFRADGNLEFLGRIDHQVKLRGFRIELGEIESVLASHPAIRDCAVVAREEVPGDKRLIAYVIAQPGQPPSGSSLREYLAAKLPDYMLPAAFVFLAALPLSPNGKVDRAALPAPAYELREHGFDTPRTPVEQTLADIFAQTLHLERVGVHDNFFALGGHSLLATQVVSRVRNLLGVELSMAALFATPTVAGLAAAVGSPKSTVSAQDIPAVAPIPRDAPLPLSFAQQRLWILEQLEPGLPLYNVPLGLRLRGRLDRASLRLALSEIVRRHESLRTTFASGEPEPLQCIHPPPESWPLPLVDLSALAAPEREAELVRLAEQEARLPFSLEHGPLLRTTLFCISEQDHVLLLTLHHIISDGWSLDVLFRELSALYAAGHEHRPAELSPLVAQVADISAWQRRLLQGESMQQSLAYWKQQLAGWQPLELPADRPRPPLLSHRGRILPFAVDARLGADLKTLAQSQQATLFMTLLGAFALLLSRYSQQADITIGSPIANRTCTEMEPLIGCFVNTLVLRTSLAGNPTFRDLLARVRQSCLDAYAHQQLPFERLVDELQVPRDRSRNPLFQVMFALQNAPLGELRLPDLEGSYFFVHHQTAKFDLTLSLEERADGSLAGLFEYATDLFEPATIERMIGHYTRLLQGIVERPDKAVFELPLLTDAERQLVVSRWNDNRVPLPGEKGLAQRFETQVAQTPDSVAVVYEGEQLTYGELNAWANQLAHHLRRQGVGPDVLVGLALDRSLELVVAVLGILKAGGAFVPLDPEHPKDRIAFMLEDSQPAALVTRRSFLERFGPVGIPTTCMDERPQLDDLPTTNPMPEGSPHQLAYAIYTSGSTGRPKGACIAQVSVLNLAYALHEQAFFGPPLRVGWVFPIFFDGSIIQIFGSLLFGHCLYVVSESKRRDAAALLTFLRTQQIQLWDCTPALLGALLDAGLAAESGLALRTIYCGGEGLPTALVAALYAQNNHPHLTLINAYGPTECCVIATTCELTAAQPVQDRAVATIGRPLPNVQVYILDPQLQPVPIGVPGEIYIGGMGLGRGYLNRPELTREKFLAHPFSTEPGARLYRTGDLGRFLADGNIEFLGRIDHQVKLRGFRIELGEIESVLSSHPLVRACVVAAREDTPGDKRLIAYVVPQPEQTPTAASLREHLAAKLPDYMLPAALVFLDALPQSPTGKLDRKALPAPSYERGPEPLAAPRTPLEQLLVEIFSQLLHRDPISIHDNFFSLGGHSLLAVRLFTQLAQRTGRTLPLATLFHHPTIAGLAAALEAQTPAQAHQTVLSLQPAGTRPPLFCIHPVGGHVLCYVALARALGTAQPVYGVQATPVAAEDSSPPETLEAVAGRYVAAIKKVQPSGPYQLLGWSLGGVLAFEMARQLVQAGQQVALLALLDSYAPGSPLPELQAAPAEQALLRWFLGDLTRQNGDSGDQELPLQGLTELGPALSLLRARGLLPPDAQEAQLEALYALFRRNLQLAPGYRPGVYAGPLLLLQAASPAVPTAPDHGWRELCSGPLELVELPGDHYTIMGPAAVGAVARHLGSRLIGGAPADRP